MNTHKEKAIKLRQEGYSYGMIRDKLGVSKSTLCVWLSRVPFIPNKEVIERIGAARVKSALQKQRLKFENIERMKREAAEEIGTLSRRDLLMLGIGLYIGEGSKSQEEIRIVNANPAIMKLAIKWLKEFCGIKQCHLRAAIHGYPDHDVSKLLRFWSRELDLPEKQFIKTSIDIRKEKSDYKKRKLPHGTAHVYVRGGGTLPSGVKGLHRKIMGWIESSVEQV
jgi:hypothetical protein